MDRFPARPEDAQPAAIRQAWKTPQLRKARIAMRTEAACTDPNEVESGSARNGS